MAASSSGQTADNRHSSLPGYFAMTARSKRRFPITARGRAVSKAGSAMRPRMVTTGWDGSVSAIQTSLSR